MPRDSEQQRDSLYGLWIAAHNENPSLMVSAYILTTISLAVDYWIMGSPLKASIPGAVITTIALVAFGAGVYKTLNSGTNAEGVAT